MTPSHRVVATEIGMIRIYMKPGERIGSGKGRWFSGPKPLYRELVAQAKEEGLMNAVAHQSHHGYSNHGPVHDDGAESLNPELTVCVEMIGTREQLEGFCSRHGAQLTNKVIVYKHLEHWSVSQNVLGTSGRAA